TTIADNTIGTMRAGRTVAAMSTGSGEVAYRRRISNGSTATIRAGWNIAAPITGKKPGTWKNACGTLWHATTFHRMCPLMRSRRRVTGRMAAITGGNGVACRPRTRNGSTATTRAGWNIVAPTTGRKPVTWKNPDGTVWS